MNKKFLLIILFSIYSNLSADVNTRISFVTNSFNSPIQGTGTLILEVEAQSSELIPFQVEISKFTDAFQLDTNLISQIQSVTFSDQRFDPLNYIKTEQFNPSDGSVSYDYTFGSGTRATVSNSLSWTVIVRIVIQYTMAPSDATISWYSGTPDYFVTDENNIDITGNELIIPDELIDFPLPVELYSFFAKPVGSSVELKWQTQTEINNLGFQIERKVINQNPIDWENLVFIAGSGNSNSIKNYSYTDKNPVGGTKFIYRLKQIDNDGKYSYSPEVEAELIPEKFELFQIFPNPFNPLTNIKFHLVHSSKVQLEIFNIEGELVATLLNKEMQTGSYIVPFSADNLSSGIYFCKIQTQNLSQIRKMILLK